MMFRTALLAASFLSAIPAYAAIDPPAASREDARIRSVAYNPNNPVELPVSPGASVRLQVGADEEVVQIVVSDQRTLYPTQGDGVSGNASLVGGGAGASKGPSSCDANLCRAVAGNFVYLRPLRILDSQPLFIQTKRCPGDPPKCEMVPYTIELLTRPADIATSSHEVAWAVTFTYPDRVKAEQAADATRRRNAAAVLWRERQANRPAPLAIPSASANFHYGYRGSTAVKPDESWDDGRTTFLRFYGNRRLPDVYRRLPDGKESIAAYAPETDPAGTTLRIARTETKWFLRDGDESGCLFNVGPDPDGRGAATVADAPTTAPLRLSSLPTRFGR